ncbi:Serine/threonine protein kinase [Sinosporangium album]|uniref:non-specific serine/threonine protein kinase n=2 Tax=Sinosporangium album TaxID=504805 RepID=A0A1G8G2K2_9ACTN|nr:Serine/threonine protein kinase [Sinosporangium album]
MMVAGRYELRQALARGGIGELWEGVDVRLRRPVAVKRIRGDRLTEDAVRRFNREARVMASFRHPGVAAVHDFGSDDFGLFLVMDLVEGWTVTDVLDAHDQVPVPWAALIGAQVCAVLSAAHERSLIHRDLKPSNLMVCRDATVVVLDFGMATVLDSSEQSLITGTMDRPGTDVYMAPEQITWGRVGAATDLYAVGCVLYEMLTGRRVFEAADPALEVRGHLEREPVRPAVLEPSVPAEVDEVVMSLLAKEPERRPRRAEDVVRRLLPYARALPPLPGVVDRGLRPVHLYARAVARISW